MTFCTVVETHLQCDACQTARLYAAEPPAFSLCFSTDRVPCALCLLAVVCIDLQLCLQIQPYQKEHRKAAGVRAEVTKRIKALGETGRAREAVSELAQMARLGVQPDTQAGTALLHACVRNGQLDMAQAVFEELFGESKCRCGVCVP